MDDIILNQAITIPASAVQIQFSRSGGKGGQHVNKVSTKVELFVSIHAILCAKKTKVLLFNNLRSSLDSTGTLRIVSQSSRSQWQNKKIAFEKLVNIVSEASIEEKERVATKPTRSSKRRRVENKIKEGQKKILRLKNIDHHEY